MYRPGCLHDSGCDGRSHSLACNSAHFGPPSSIGDTCCGQCPGATCYVDQVTGA